MSDATPRPLSPDRIEQPCSHSSMEKMGFLTPILTLFPTHTHTLSPLLSSFRLSVHDRKVSELRSEQIELSSKERAISKTHLKHLRALISKRANIQQLKSFKHVRLWCVKRCVQRHHNTNDYLFSDRSRTSILRVRRPSHLLQVSLQFKPAVQDLFSMVASTIPAEQA